MLLQLCPTDDKDYGARPPGRASEPRPHSVDFRQLRVLVVHPRDREGELMIRYLQRLGCQVDVVWPPAERCEAGPDLVFCLVDPAARGMFAGASELGRTAVVAIVGQGDAQMLSLLNDLGPQAVLSKPFNRESILTNLLVARNNKNYQRRLQTKVSRLEETLRSVRKVERAKMILMEKRKIGESQAYAYLRDQAMKKRIPIGVVASVIIDSREVLSGESEETESPDRA